MTFRNMLACGALAVFGTVGTASAMSTAAKRVEIQEMEGAKLVEYAAIPYVQFREDIDVIAKGLPEDEAGMRDVHHRLASHDNRSMAGAWVAYAAMVAADTPAFLKEIERRVDKDGKARFFRELERNPAVVRNMAGSQEAVDRIMAFATNDAAKLRKLGDSFIASAYDLQKTAWARREIALEGMERVDSALRFAAARQWKDHSERKVDFNASGIVRPKLASYDSWSPRWSGESVAVNPEARAGTIVTKALVLGAHYAMDTAKQEHMAAYATSAKSERCFTSAKLNLDQCIAATRTPYEEAFCIGQHALNDMSSCVGWPAGAGASGS